MKNLSTIGIVFALILAAVLLWSFFKKTPTPAAAISTNQQQAFNPDES